MSARSCRTCEYFDPTTSRDGLCRFNAPTAYATDADPSMMAHWPIVRRVDWCGSWYRAVSTPSAKPPLWRRMLTPS